MLSRVLNYRLNSVVGMVHGLVIALEWRFVPDPGHIPLPTPLDVEEDWIEYNHLLWCISWLH
jgi:hypothetical protein